MVGRDGPLALVLVPQCWWFYDAGLEVLPVAIGVPTCMCDNEGILELWDLPL